MGQGTETNEQAGGKGGESHELCQDSALAQTNLECGGSTPLC